MEAGDPKLTINTRIGYSAIVKTVSRNISLVKPLDDFAVEEAKNNHYGNISAFFADMLRAKREAKAAALAKEYQDLAGDGAPGHEPVKDVVAHVNRARKRLRNETRRAT